MVKGHLKPKFQDDDEYLDISSDEQIQKEEEVSFGALKKSQGRSTNNKKSSIKNESNDFKRDRFGKRSISTNDDSKTKQKNKHAPIETSSKVKVSRIREVPNLNNNTRNSTLYKDIRFDTAFGKSDIDRIRKDYKFLDDYRNDEIKKIDSILKDSKMVQNLSNYEVEQMEYQKKSLQSRLTSLQNKDLEKKILKDYQSKHSSNNNENKYYLKENEKRKIIQKYKFDHMKASQREKVVERKRKRRLGKEFKQLEFNKPRN